MNRIEELKTAWEAYRVASTQTNARAYWRGRLLIEIEHSLPLLLELFDAVRDETPDIDWWREQGMGGLYQTFTADDFKDVWDAYKKLTKEINEIRLAVGDQSDETIGG